MRKLSPTCDHNDRYNYDSPKQLSILIDDYHYTYHYTRNTIPLNLANCVRRTADRFRMISLNRHGTVRCVGFELGRQTAWGQAKKGRGSAAVLLSVKWSVQWQAQIDKAWSTNYVWEVLPNTHNLLKWHPQKKKLGSK
jgi:hypothetical protein